MMNLYFSHTQKETFKFWFRNNQIFLFGYFNRLDGLSCIEKRVHIFLYSTKGEKLPLNKL